MLKNIETTGESLIVTHRGKPMVRVDPLRRPGQKRIVGGLKGQMKITGDIVNTDDASAWESLTP